jgi:hypothetical protein
MSHEGDLADVVLPPQQVISARRGGASEANIRRQARALARWLHDLVRFVYSLEAQFR